MTTNSEYSGSVGFDVEENLGGAQGCASDGCSRDPGQNTAESGYCERQNNINGRDGYSNKPITAFTELEVAAPEVELECNFDTLAVEGTEYSSTNEMDCHAIGVTEKQTVLDSVELCRKWSGRSGFYVTKRGGTERAYAHSKHMVLTLLFLYGTFLKFIRKWASPRLLERGYKTQPLRVDELHAYIGLELATSIKLLNNLKHFWPRSALSGNDLLNATMSRDKFLQTRACLRPYPTYEPDVANVDLLWHSRYLVEHFQRNAATMAVPKGVSSLDENIIHCKRRTAAHTYMKSKPVKFGIRFCAIVGWSHSNLHSIFDNGSGNKTRQSPVIRYTSVFRELRRPVENNIGGFIVAESFASALWCAQAAPETQIHLTPQHGRLLVMGNIYTRLTMARQNNALSDGEVLVLGTVRLNVIDAINRSAVNDAVKSLKSAERGSWMLCQVFNSPSERSGAPTVATKSGLIVFRDRSVVTLYTNYLSDTPSQRTEGPSDHTISCVHGVGNRPRWLEGEGLSRSKLSVPAPVDAYNSFVNGVDRFDQYRSTSKL